MKKLLLILLCLPFIGLGQDEALDNSKSKKISFLTNAGIGLGFVQDKNSPLYHIKLGIGNDGFKLHLVGTSNYFFSTRSDNSRELAIDKYLGLELLLPSSHWLNNRGDDKWGGVGVSYCIQNDSELHKKTPFKGSAIFIHLTNNYKPTAGCIALKKKDFEIMLKLINQKTKIKIG